MFFWPQTIENSMVCHHNISEISCFFAVLKFSVLYFVHAIIFDSFVAMNIASLGDKINFCWAAAIVRPIFEEKNVALVCQVYDYLYFYLQHDLHQFLGVFQNIWFHGFVEQI